MIELLRTSDIVMLSILQAELEARGLDAVVFDAFTSALEAGTGAFPRRLMVADDDEAEARQVLAEFQVDHP